MTLRPHSRVRELSLEVLFRGNIFDLVRQSLRLPSGLTQNLELVDHPGAVAVAARHDDGRCLVVRQYRAAVGDWTTEIPAGRLEAGEDPLVAAQRELEEETGFRADTWRTLTSFYPAPGFASEVIHLFLATGLSPAGDDRRPPDDDEELDVSWMTPEELLALPIQDAKTRIAGEMLARGV